MYFVLNKIIIDITDNCNGTMLVASKVADKIE